MRKTRRKKNKSRADGGGGGMEEYLRRVDILRRTKRINISQLCTSGYIHAYP